VRIFALGVPINVRFDASIPRADQERIASAWERCQTASGRPGGLAEDESTAIDVVLRISEFPGQDSADAYHQIRAHTVTELEQALASGITLWAIEAQKHNLLMIHAAGICDEHGRTVILAAPSGTGKTTLARVLCSEEGSDRSIPNPSPEPFAYVSDETVALTREGEVVMYPKPLSIVEGDAGVKKQVEPGHLALRRTAATETWSTSLQPGLLVIVERDAGGPEHPDVRRLGASEGLVRLVSQVSFLPMLRDPLKTLIGLIERCGGVHHIRYREADTLGAVIHRLLDESAPVPIVWEPAADYASLHEGADDEIPGEHAGPDDPVLRRSSAVVDGVWIEDQLMLLGERELVGLSDAGSAIWETLVHPMSPEQLFAELGGGAPPLHGESIRAAFMTVVDELVSGGILERMD